MAHWRTKGVVEDSEEEEDLTGHAFELETQEQDSLQRTQSPQSDSNSASSILKSANQPNRAIDHSIPLPSTLVKDHSDSSQDLPSSSSLLQHGSSGRLSQNDEVEQTVWLQSHLDQSELSSPLSDVPSVLENPEYFVSRQSNQQQDEEISRPDLHLRKRTLIQLHPYLLESERYRNTMKASGVRPAQIANRALEQDSFGQSGSSQDTDFVSDPNSSSPLHHDPSEFEFLPSLDESIEQLELPGPCNYAPPANSEDELPDINAFLSRDTKERGKKRRRLMHISIPSSSKQTPTTSTAAHKLPPSPPISSQSPPTAKSNPAPSRFRVPKDLAQLPTTTPISFVEFGETASGNANIPPGWSPRSRVSKEPSPSRTHGQIIISSDSSGSESKNCSDGTVELKRLRKRIKGVLPASWLKLDKQSRLAHEKAADGHHVGLSPQHHAKRQRGVAQKYTRKNMSPSESTLTKEATWKTAGFNPRPTNDEISKSRSRQVPDDVENFSSVVRDNDTDTSDMEASWLDPMLPALAQRQRSAGGRSRKKQTKLGKSFRRHGKATDIERGNLQMGWMLDQNHKKQQKTNSTLSKNREQRWLSLPRLSVLDIAPTPENAPSKLPQFLRVAARQARKRPGYGRQSARGKYIKLHTYQDTEDANELLCARRTGKILSNEQAQPVTFADHFPPLRERQNNQQRIAKRTFGAEEKIAKESKATERHLSIPKMKSSSQQQTLGHVRLLQTSRAIKPTSQQSTTQNNQQRGSVHLTCVNQPFGRVAQLETLEEDFDDAHPEVAFKRKLSRLEDLKPKVHVPKPTATHQSSQVGRKSRKGIPIRVDAEAKSYRQPTEPLPIDRTVALVTNSSDDLDLPSLQGLGPYGTQYATNFDVFPLQSGTYFHQSTFIGSGAFSEAISPIKRSLDEPGPATIVSFNECHWSWSHWDSQLESQLEIIFNTLLDGNATASFPAMPSSQDLETLEAIMRWLSRSLSFPDPVDRSYCLSKMLGLLEALRNNIVSSANVCPTEQVFGPVDNVPYARVLAQLIVLGIQLLQISDHPAVSQGLMAKLKAFVVSSCKALLSLLLSKGMTFLRAFQERNQRHTVREAGIQDYDMAVQCLVVVRHTLETPLLEVDSFWKLVNDHYISTAKHCKDATTFDRIWYNLFTLLPFLEFDQTGFLCVGSRFQSSLEDWSLVKSLVARLCVLMSDSKGNQGATINDYFRATLSRCFNLISKWGWRKCEPILGVVFDFFAQNELGLLQNEQSFGSPTFLGHLDQEPDLSLQLGDSSFHVFLKMLATGLQGLQSIYPENKIRSAVYRFVPAHGRIHRKEDMLQQQHLDAVRNHHDLLCTLYWAVAPPCQPRVSLLHNLVDHAHSHREICRLNTRSWINLVRFQISRNDPDSTLEPFAHWYKEIIETNLSQYRHARIEVEEQYQQASLNGQAGFSQSLLEPTILSNQRQVVALIRDMLFSLKSAIRSAKNLEALNTLLQRSAALDLLVNIPLNSADHQLLPVISDCLDLAAAYIDRNMCDKTAATLEPAEESQEYGDWSGFDAVEPDDTATEQHPLAFVLKPLTLLLSNAFGADQPPQDATLVKIVDVWIKAAGNLVQQGWKDWSTYLGPYGSWNQMRDTEQKRRHTPYFLARIIESWPSCLAHCSVAVKSGWVESLLERESRLRYQNRLTAAQLNVSKDELLFRNMPFAATNDGKYDISLSEFKERRLSIISVLLSNMRESFEHSDRMSNIIRDTRSEYTGLIDLIQAVMKRNYQELQNNTGGFADQFFLGSCDAESVTGAYVTLVQNVVSLLQQHASEIVPIDRFFTDSAAFPLPNTDPTYVTGRLKSYALQSHLTNSQKLKQLAIFVLTTSERALIDGQQAYLVSQIQTAMEDEYGAHTHTLRRLLLIGIFPAFIDHAFGSIIGALVSRPILQVSAMAFQDLKTKFSVFDQSSAKAVIDLCTSFLAVLERSIQQWLRQSGHLEEPLGLSVVAMIYESVIAILPLVDYLHRATAAAMCAYELILSLTAIGRRIQASLDEIPSGQMPTSKQHFGPETSDKLLKDVYIFCGSEISKEFEKGWSWSDGKLWWRPGGGMKQEVSVDFESVKDEGARFSEIVDSLSTATEQLASGHSGAELHLKLDMAPVFL